MASCTPTDDKQPQETPEESGISEAATYDGGSLPDLAVEQIPYDVEWDGDHRTSQSWAHSEEVLAFSGGAAPDAPTVHVNDLATGALAWSRTENSPDELLRDAGQGAGSIDFSSVAAALDGDQLFFAYGSDACEDSDEPDCAEGDVAAEHHHGLIALNAADGQLQWAQPVNPALDEDLSPEWTVVSVAAATENTAVANVHSRDDNGDSADVIVGLESTSGDILWSLRDHQAVSGTDDVVLATASSSNSQKPLMGIDADTGEPRWSAEESDAHGSWAMDRLNTSEQFAAASIEGNPGLSLVNLGNGDVIDPVEESNVTVAAGDGDLGTLLAWTQYDGHAATLFSSDDVNGDALAGEHTLEKTRVATIDDAGYIWLTDENDHGTYAVDRTGEARTDEIPGELLFAHAGRLATLEDGQPRLWSYGP